MKIIIVRHGQYDSFFGSLTEEGEKNMRELTKKISFLVKGFNAVIYHSPVLRAAESAEIIAK